MPKKSKRQGRRYSEAEKMAAVQIVLAAGGKLSNELLNQIRLALKSPALDFKSVVQWVQKYTTSPQSPDPTPANSTQNSAPSSTTGLGLDFNTTSARAIVEHTFRQYAERANKTDVIGDTDGRDAVRNMVDTAKLMQLLDGLPTEIIGVMSDLIATIRRKGYDPASALNDVKAEFAALPDAPMVTQSHGAN